MNKLVTVFGIAAVATLAGCKDPNYKPMSSQNDVKTVAPEPTCTCAPGTKHTEPCACGAADCTCAIEVKPIEVKPVEKPVEKPVAKPAEPAPVVKTAEPETTIYVVQNGDYLSKISKKYNVTINSIKRLNNLTSDTVRVGQKLKLPGKIDVGEQSETVKTAAIPAKAVVPYTGETKEYVVKGGDTLGAIAYGNGCNIRQLKELNGLKSDTVKVGQKLKVPANGKAAEKKPAPQKVAPVKPVVEPTPAKETPAAKPQPVVDAPVVETPAPTPVESTVEEPAAEPATATYTVQEGDDMTGVSIRFCVSPAAIRELNNLPEGAQLTQGQVIKLPADAQQ